MVKFMLTFESLSHPEHASCVTFPCPCNVSLWIESFQVSLHYLKDLHRLEQWSYLFFCLPLINNMLDMWNELPSINFWADKCPFHHISTGQPTLFSKKRNYGFCWLPLLFSGASTSGHAHRPQLCKFNIHSINTSACIWPFKQPSPLGPKQYVLMLAPLLWGRSPLGQVRAQVENQAVLMPYTASVV